MGLDMYFYKKTYVQNWKHTPEEKKTKVSVKLGGKKHPGINPEKVTYIQEEVGYWRKANHIHEWFVNNCQNGVDECQEAYVDLEKLKNLLDVCITVRDSSKLIPASEGDGRDKLLQDSTVAEDLLPTQSGFFFGGTGYDQWYMKDITDTIKMIETELKKYDELEKSGLGLGLPEYYYRSSW